MYIRILLLASDFNNMLSEYLHWAASGRLCFEH